MSLLRKIFICVLCLATLLPAVAQEKILFLNEGQWQTDNGRLSYFEGSSIVSNQYFRDANGWKLGDTPNNIIQIDDNRLAIAVNWGNIVQFTDIKGKAISATEDVPNNRYMVSDGRYLYITSYAHDVVINGATRSFVRGFVAKIDLDTYRVTDAVEVGYEPEGIALYDGHLFVANSGGYAFQEDHDYERTVSIIDASKMKVTRTVDAGAINLYGVMSRAGQYLCINSSGDYYEVEPCTVIFDCRAALDGKPDAQCRVVLAPPSIYNTATTDGKFMAVGAAYSAITGESHFYTHTIDPAEVMRTGGRSGLSSRLPGTIAGDVQGMQNPYSFYVNPYTGYFYGTDAADSMSAGRFYQWTPEGRLAGVHKAYINPGHILALPPDGHFGGVEGVVADSGSEAEADSTIYNLQGIPVTDPIPGNIYIRAGKKFVKH